MEKKTAKQLSDNDLVAVMTLRSAESALRRQDGVQDADNAASESRSEVGTATPTSTQDGRSVSQSPIHPKAKARTS